MAGVAEVADLVVRGASFLNSKNSKKVRGASRSDFADPGGPPRPESQAVPGEGFSGAVAARSCTAQSSRAVIPRGDRARLRS